MPRTRLWDRVYCLRTADKAFDTNIVYFSFLQDLQAKKRADERTRTADLISLRVIGHVLHGCAGSCKSRIFRGVSFLRVALCCTALRSQWCQSGVNRGGGLYLAATVIPEALELRASYSNVTDAQPSDPGIGRHSPEAKRVASRSASSASEESMPATCSKSMAVERTWETSALVSRSLLL